MTTRASITLTTNRAPPKRRHIPNRPPDGYHVTESAYEQTAPAPEPTRDFIAEIRQTLATIEELDLQMIEIDDRIDTYDALLADPNADGWDRIDAEAKAAPLLEQRNRLSDEARYQAYTIETAGRALIDGWKEHELDNIGKELTQVDGVLDRVRVEYPELLNLPAWKRLEAAACPF